MPKRKNINNIVRRNYGSDREYELVPARNVTINNHRTSVRLADDMWEAFKEIADWEGKTVHVLAEQIDRNKPKGKALTDTLKVYILNYYRTLAKALLELKATRH